RGIDRFALLRQRVGARGPDGVSERPGWVATDRRPHAPRQGDAGHADQVPYGTACPPLHRASSLVAKSSPRIDDGNERRGGSAPCPTPSPLPRAAIRPRSPSGSGSAPPMAPSSTSRPAA